LAIKEQLRNELTPEEWNLWVRPARLVQVMDQGKGLLIAVPPVGKVIAAATARRPLLQEIGARSGIHGIGVTVYPDEWQREEIKRRFPGKALIDWKAA
jgi:hypothetical protein